MDLFIPKILHMVRAGEGWPEAGMSPAWEHLDPPETSKLSCWWVPLSATTTCPLCSAFQAAALAGCLPGYGQILSLGALVLPAQRQTSVIALCEQLGSKSYWMGPTYHEAVALTKTHL